MKARVIAAVALAIATLPAQAAPPTTRPPPYKPPAETAALAPGDDAALVTAACSICHSVDYITTQPSGLPEPAAFWTAEVAKMQTAYGAPLSPEDARIVVAYLARHYR